MITQALPEWMTMTNLKTFRDGAEVRIWRCSVELDGIDDFLSRTGETQDSAVMATMRALHDMSDQARMRIDAMALTLQRD